MNAKDLIISIVSKIPGIRYKELQRMIKMPNGTLSYHIDILSKQGCVRVMRDSGSTRLFPIDIDEHKASIIGILRDGVRLRIVKYLLKHDKASFNELYKIANRSCSTLSWHLDRLIDANIIKVTNTTGMNEYSLKDKDLISYIIARYLDEVDNFIELWDL